jgi:hypothetical protein
MVILTDPIFQGMAVSLIFGGAVATLLTLLIIPLGCISAAGSMGTCATGNEPPHGGSGGHAPTQGKPGKSAAEVGKEVATYAGMYGVALAKGTWHGVRGWIGAGRKLLSNRRKKSQQKLQTSPVPVKSAPAPVISPPEVLAVEASAVTAVEAAAIPTVEQLVENAADTSMDSASVEAKERKKAPARRGIKLKTDI